MVAFTPYSFSVGSPTYVLEVTTTAYILEEATPSKHTRVLLLTLFVSNYSTWCYQIATFALKVAPPPYSLKATSATYMFEVTVTTYILEVAVPFCNQSVIILTLVVVITHPYTLTVAPAPYTHKVNSATHTFEVTTFTSTFWK